MIGGFKIGLLPLGVIACFAALLVAEELMRRGKMSPPDWPRITTNWGLGLASWLLAAMVPASSLIAALWTGPGLLARWPAPLAFLAFLLARSLTAYWLHRLFHAAPWLWRIHRVHHADTAIDCTTALRNHLFELPAVTVLAALVILALGPPMPIVAAVEAVLIMANFWQHAAIRLPEGLARRLEWIMITPRLHLLHHAQARQDHDSNFGDLLSLWDRLFRTFTPPRSAPINVGLLDEARGAQSLARQLASPFRP